MRRFKLFSLIQEHVARQMSPRRWSARRRASWSDAGRSAAVESLETRCLLSAGDLDPSFGVAGRVTTAVGTSAQGQAVLIQSNGKILVAGVGNANDFALARYNSDGSLDTSFDGDGKLTTDFASGVDAANSIALQTDGKIVVAGLAHGDFALARYNSDGSLDTSFDGDGKLTTSFSSGIDFANSVAFQADGKIVVAGISDQNTASTRFALARYNSDGSLDTAFDGDGTLTSDFGVGFIGQAYELTLQTDGKIIVAGRSFFTSGGPNFALVRYNGDGSLDTSFDGDGKLTTDFTASEDYGNAVALQNDGRIVVAGYTFGGGSFDFALARYNSDGSLDTSFDGDGKLTTDFITGDDYAYDVVVQNDGKIVVVGSSNLAFALARYNSDGSLDTSFNEDGILLTVFGSVPRGEAKSVALQPDGKIVVAGYSGGYFALARYIADGSPTITSASSVNVVENTTGVLTVAGTDPEHGALTYSLAGGADDALFSLNLTTGALAFLAAPNFESPQDADHNNVYDVQVSVSDGSNAVTQDIHVTVTNVDETPSITSANAVSVLENATSVLTVTASDPEGHFLLYGISGGVDQSKFSINPFSGALSFTSAPDFESATDANHDNSYELTVVASDGTNLVAQNISVSVTNTNEAPAFTSGNSASVPENTTALVSLAATDPEQNSLSYSISGGPDSASFDIDSASGAVSFMAVSNFENPTDSNHDNVYSVQVQVSDGTNLVTQNLSVSVTNVEESPTITSASTISIAENTSFVVTVTGSDPEGHLPHFGITGGDDQAKFTLNFLTGALSFVSPPDFEHPTDGNLDNVYEVQVAVSDGTHLVTQNVSVTVTNVNETVTIPLPAIGGNFKTLFLNGQLHLRSSLGKQMIAPVTLPSGADVQFNGSNSADRLTLDRSWSNFTGSLTLNGNGGNDQLDARTVSLGVTFNGGDGNDTFLGGRGDDTTNGGAGLDSLSGNDGNDSLSGGDANDKLYGGTGGDILRGDAGTDFITGGDDDDSLSGGDANDTLNGDAGNDTITGDAGADVINGGDDDDLLFGNAGNDAIDGGTGDDVIDGGEDFDNLKGSDGNDAIRGGNGNDTLSGGKGDDLLTGSAGNDSLLGDDGTDTLLGDAGNDILKGGNGIDIINGVLSGPSRDTISDSTKVIDTSFAFDFDALLADLL